MKLRRLAVVAGMAGSLTLTLALLAARPASADIAFGCPVPSTTTPTTRLNPADLGISFSWALSDGVSGTATDQFVDLDGDGTDDVWIEVTGDTGWDPTITSASWNWAAWAWDYTEDWYNYALHKAIDDTAIDQVLLDRMGIDLASWADVSTAWTGYELGGLPASITSGNPWPSGTTMEEGFRQQIVELKVHALDYANYAPADGTYDLDLTMGRTDATTGTDTGLDDAYSVGLDTTGSSGATSAWPDHVQLAVLLDWEHNLAGVGLDSFDDTNTRIPWSTLKATADISMVEGDSTDIQATVGHQGVLSGTTSGHPGASAVVGLVDCGDATDPASTPFDWIAAGYDTSASGGLVPETLEAEIAFGGAASETYLHLDVDDPPSGFDALLSSADADVDGDGSSDDWLDVDGDGEIDGLPWNRVELSRSADSVPSVEVVLVDDPSDGMRTNLYAALKLEEMPEHVAADYAGPVTPEDTDGDGVADAAAGSLTYGHVRFCDPTWGTWPASTCATAPETSGDALLSVYSGVDAVLPAPEADGDYPPEYGSFAPAPVDITATAAAHFTPAPGHFFDLREDESAGTTQLLAHLDGLRELTYDAADDVEIELDTSALGQVGVSARLTGPDGDADGTPDNTTDVWGAIADVPEHAEITYDSADISVDGDPREMTWRLTDSTGAPATTGAAFAVDWLQTNGDMRLMELAGWLGHGTGASDGIPSEATVSFDLEGDESEVIWDAASPMWAEVGLSTSTATDRANSAGALVTRMRAEALIPDELDVYWSENDGKLERADFTTCTGGSGCPVDQPRATITQTAGAVDETALSGVVMPEIPDSDGVLPDSAYDPFTSRPDWLHYVLRFDPATEGAPDPTKELQIWGIDLHVSQLETGALTFKSVRSEQFNRVDACLSGRTHGAEFGLGGYTDAESGGASYADLTQTIKTGATALELQVEVNLPTDGEGGSTIGDVSSAQETTIRSFPGDTALLEIVRRECGDMSGHTSDPAPGTVAPDAWPEATLSGRIQAGTESSVLRTVGLEDPAVSVPTSNGIDAALHSADYMGGGDYTGIDAGLGLPLPGRIEIRNPIALVCGGGNQPDGCQTEETFDLQTSQEIWLSVTSNQSHLVGLGELDVQYVSDDVARSGSETDDSFKRIALHLDKLPSSFRAEGTLTQRARDGVLVADVDITDTNVNSRLEPLWIKYWDEYDPARKGAENEARADHPDNEGIPNWYVAFENMTNHLYVRADLLLAAYGNQLSYEADDCTGWSWPAASSHVHSTDGSAPDDWTPRGPRDVEDVRGSYVHAVVDMQQEAEELVVDVAKNVAYSRQSEDYDKDATWRTKALIQADNPIDADVAALLPMAQHLDVKKWYANSELCLDAEVPVEIELDNTTEAGLALDATKATLTRDTDDTLGEITLSFQESFTDTTGAEVTEEGMWVEELYVHTNLVGWDWYTFLDQERKTLGIIDPGDLNRNDGNIPQTTVEVTDLVDPSQWSSQNLAYSTHESGWFIFDPFFVKADEDFMTSPFWHPMWNGLWNAADNSSDSLRVHSTEWWEPEIDVTATASNRSTSHTTSCILVGETFTANSTGGSMEDGTSFQMTTRHGGAGRYELYLRGYYDNGDLRFVRELADLDSNAAGCKRWRVSYTLDTVTFADQGIVELEYTIEHKKAFAWKEDVTRTILLDASGNGWETDGSLTVTDSTPGTDQEVTFSGGESTGTCQWLPGDGSAYTVPAGEDATTFTWAYDFPGTYRAIQLCYSGPGDGEPSLHEAEVTVT